MNEALTTEHTIPYQWDGKQHFMLIRKIKTQYERFYVIRTGKCEYTLQFYDMRWNIISPRHNRFNKQLLETVGKAIWDSGLSI